MPALEVTGLVKTYAGRRVVDGLTLSAEAGTVLALLGPNGAGKTTTVEVCEGFRRADGGAVRVLGCVPGDPSLRARVGVMPQSGGAYSTARAGELLRLFASYYAHPLDAGELLERLGLLECERTTWRRLSGGQQQRLSLAMAVVGRPELVFLDEPTAGLDVQARQATWQLVEDLRAAGVTTVLTTHAMDEAERLADQVVIISAGRLVAEGSPAELTRQEQPTICFRSVPGLTGPAWVEVSPGRYRVAVEGEVGPALAELTRSLTEQGHPVDDVSTGRRSLEELYLEVTSGEVMTGGS